MTSTMPLVLILLAVLVASFYYLMQAEGGIGEFPRLLKRAGVPIDRLHWPIVKTEKRTERGGDLDKLTEKDTRFSRGKCADDNDCFVGGCSGEVCSSEKGVSSTCEYRNDFPNEREYDCGCRQETCKWQKK